MGKHRTTEQLLKARIDKLESELKKTNDKFKYLLCYVSKQSEKVKRAEDSLKSHNLWIVEELSPEEKLWRSNFLKARWVENK